MAVADEEDDAEAWIEVRRAHEECRSLLQRTMVQYKQQHPAASFELFMQHEWPDDFKLMQTTTRSYADWRSEYALVRAGPPPEV